MAHYPDDRAFHKDDIQSMEAAEENNLHSPQNPGYEGYEYTAEARLRRIKKVVYFIVHVISIFILIRFVLVALGADPANMFANFVYTLTHPFILPFRGLFGDLPPPQYQVSVLEGPDLVAIFIYYLFAWIGFKIANYTITRPGGRQSQSQNVAHDQR